MKLWCLANIYSEYSVIAIDSCVWPHLIAEIVGFKLVYCMIDLTIVFGYWRSVYLKTLPKTEAVICPSRWSNHRHDHDIDWPFVAFSKNVASSLVTDNLSKAALTASDKTADSGSEGRAGL